MMPPTNAQLAKIHIAKKDLQLTDDVYRDILVLNFKGVQSAKGLTILQAEQLLENFKSKGWKPKKAPAGAPRMKRRDGHYIDIKPGPTAKQQRKVLAMWNSLGYGMDKLHARCKRQFGVERFEWLTIPGDLHVLITDLKKRQDSAGVE
ncbi:MAG: regulatory protein GemA [Desulfocapsa sp.]|nr:regulatory protein GemA [Desulfocapsa sp.]